VRSKKEFKERFEEIKYEEIVIKNKIPRTEIKQFISDWFLDADKRVYEKFDFVPPPIKIDPRIFNTWEKFDVEKLIDEGVDESTEIEAILYHIKVLCNFDERAYDYFLKWLAQIVQNPATPCGTMPILISDEGGGKGTLLKLLRYLLGELYVASTSDPLKEVFDKFSNMRMNKLVICINEATIADTRKIKEKLKDAIDAPTYNHENKNMNPMTLRNVNRFIGFSNNYNSFPVSTGDRRIFILRCSDKYCKDKEYFDNLYKHMNNDSVRVGFFNYLMNLDISKVDWINDRPVTEIYEDLRILNIHPIINFIEDLVLKRYLFNKCEEKNMLILSMNNLFNKFNVYCKLKQCNLTFTDKSFGIAFKTNIQIDKGHIVKKRTNKGMMYEINRKETFKWLKEKKYTEYDELPNIDINEDDEDDC
jgi:hypothetical protein